MSDSTPDAQSIAGHFKGAKRSGRGWRIPCPSADHGGDGGANCAIANGERGEILAICHSHACSYSSIMRGLEEAGALPKRQWKYASGKSVYRESENGKKRISQDKGAQGGEALARGNRESDVVVIVEGEPAADAVLSAAGESYTVLTWRGGSSAANKADLAEVVGKTALLWPDNDDAGREAMRTIARRCWIIGANVVRLLLPVGGEKWDAADIPAAQIPKHLRTMGEPDPEGPRNLLDVPAVRPEHSIYPLILKKDLNFLSGPGGVGKTRLVLSMLSTLAHGGNVFGHSKLVVDPIGQGLLITGGEETAETLVDMDREADCAVITTFSAWSDNEGNLTELAHDHMQIALARNYSLVVLDSISNLFYGNENDRGHVNTFLSELRAYAYLGLSILLIGHTSRQNSLWSGSTGWQTGPRSHFTIMPDEDDADVRVITLEKANRAKAGETFRVTNINPDGSFGEWREAAEPVQSSEDPMPGHVLRLVQFLKSQGVPQSFSANPAPVAKSKIMAALKVGDTFADTIFQAAAEQRALKFFPPAPGTRVPFHWLLPAPAEEAEEGLL